jgi:hypothetical protein
MYGLTTSLAVLTSHTRAVPSPEAVTMRAPSGLNAAKVRNCSCRYTPGSGAPVVAFHMRAVLSWEAVTMLAPSGLNAAEVT